MNADYSEFFRQTLLGALAAHRPLAIRGSGSKAFYGRSCAATPLEVSGHRGILSFEPSELVLTARGGTPLADIEALLAEHGQMLPFEPPHFGAGATLGGTIACGFSGPRRAFAGSARDGILGCKILDGHGQILSFGGQVMKNVAGFDLSRLMVGALGTLGILLEISLKVLPKPDAEQTLVFAMSEPEALATMTRWCAQPWPISGLAYDGSWIYLRLAGAERAVAAARQALGGDIAAEGPAFWHRLCEQRLRFFHYPGVGRDLWRLSVAPATPLLAIPGEWFYDWGGALRWLKTDIAADTVFQAAQNVGGHATLFRGVSQDGRVFQPLPPAMHSLQRRLKQVFDPKGLLNPGRLYEDL